MNLNNTDIVYIKKKDIEYIQFKKLLQYNLPHAYVLKKHNRNYRYLLNNQKEIRENYQALFKHLGLDYKYLIRQKQIHSDIVTNINSVIKFESIEGDALITNTPNLILATINADCILFLLYDPVHKVIANVHSGWRGTLKRIVIKTILKMQELYNSNPKDIICCICPSIRECHFEVDKDVYYLFKQEYSDIPLESYVKQNKNKWNIDTVGINIFLLKKIGLLNSNIIDSNLCSVCNHNYLSSYRKEGINTTEATAIISLNTIY